MPITLRPYQDKAIEDLRSFFRKNPTGNAILQSPTGTGKTIEFTFMAVEALKRNKKVAIFSNRIELMDQAGGSFKKFGINPEYLNPNTKTPSIDSKCISAMMQTTNRRILTKEGQDFIRSRDLIIADEVHGSDFDNILKSGLVDHIPIVGATATPRRMGGQTQLGTYWDEIILGEQVKYFVERGYLMQDRYFGIDAGDVSGISIDNHTGDFNPHQMYKHFDKREKYAGVIDNYRSNTDKTKTLTFCANQQHAIKTAIAFNKAGIETKFLVSGKNKPKKPDVWEADGQRIKYESDLEFYMLLQQYKHLTGDRKKMLKDLQSGKITNLVNVAMLTTGVDIPSLETVIIDKYTLSLSLYLQMLGRGSRPNTESGKINFSILDMGNAAHRDDNPLGRYMDDRQWGLWHETSKGGGIAGTKICDKNKEDENRRRGCDRLCHIGAKMCKCGYIFATKKEIKEAELKEIAYGDAVPEEVLVSNMNVLQLQAHAKLKEYNFRWIPRTLYYRAGKEAVDLAMKTNPNLTKEEKEPIKIKAGRSAVYEGLKELNYKHNYIRQHVLKYIK